MPRGWLEFRWPWCARRVCSAPGRGEMRRLFDRVVAGKYLHIRENDARLSLVTAHDCAAAVLALAGRSGVYNVSDGRGHRWVDLCEAMSANAGEFKRMPRIPARWATVIKALSAPPHSEGDALRRSAEARFHLFDSRHLETRIRNQHGVPRYPGGHRAQRQVLPLRKLT